MSKDFKNEIKAIGYIALGIVILTSAFSIKNGFLGDMIIKLLFGSVGIIGYIIPVIVVIYGVLKLINKISILYTKLPYIITVGLLLITIIQLVNLQLYETNNFFINSFESGVDKEISGGIIGGVFAWILNILFGFTGGFVVLLSFIVVLVLFVIKFNINLQKPISEKLYPPKEKVNFESTEPQKNKTILTKQNFGNITTKIKSNVNKIKDEKNIKQQMDILQKTLESFKIDAKVVNYIVGSSIIRFEIQLGIGQKFSKLTSLSNDIALSLGANGNCMINHIPGTTLVSIEIPTSNRKIIYLKNLLNEKFYSKDNGLHFVLGEDINGKPIIPDLQKLVHLLIAGATGMGKSITLNSMLVSFLNKYSPDDLKFLMVDMKTVELKPYENIPHLLKPIATRPNEALDLLRFLVQEMENRYVLLADLNTRDIKGYNEKSEEKLPKIVLIIDELAELMMVSSNETEELISRLAGKARACGIHLVLSTQKPSCDVISAIIKSNTPSRIALTTASGTDSRVILDSIGAEKLTGSGDLLFSPTGSSNLIRIQGCYVSDKEVEKTVNDIIKKYKSKNIINISKNNDELFIKNIFKQMILENQTSVGWLKSKYNIGYNKANIILKQLEDKGWLSKSENGKQREILIRDID